MRASVTKAVTGVTAFLCVVSLLASPAAQAVPQDDISQVQSRVLDLEMQAATAHERALEAQMKLADVQKELDGLRDRRDRERKRMRGVRDTINSIARTLYASGGIDPTLQALLADSPEDFLSQSAVMSHLADSQKDVLRQYRTGQLRLAQAEAKIADREKRAKEVRSEMSGAEAQVKERLAAAESVLANLQAGERQRLRRLEWERRQRQAAEARQQSQAVSQGAGNASSRVRSVIRYALSQVGRPYSMSANPPTTWDCSKLTTAAWRQAGIGLTALSYRQWDQTRRVPVSQIRPGDLVFYFGRGAHHVALYIGNGKMVSASNPRDGVEIIDFLGPWYRERFSGVGRVI